MTNQSIKNKDQAANSKEPGWVKSNQSDAQNREKIALWVLIASIAAVVLTSGVVVWQAGNKEQASQRVMDSTLPLYGTWVGTILAFYFSRNAFEAASNATTRNATLFQQVTSGLTSASPPPDNVLAKISLKSLANNLAFSQNDREKSLQEVLKDLTDKNRYRTIVVDADKKYITLVQRLNIQAFLTPPGTSPEDDQQLSSLPLTPSETLPEDKQKSSSPTLEDYLKWRNSQGEQAKPTVVFLPQNATLADADAKLKETPGCRDVIVTTDGQETSPVVVYVTDTDINEYKE